MASRVHASNISAHINLRIAIRLEHRNDNLCQPRHIETDLLVIDLLVVVLSLHASPVEAVTAREQGGSSEQGLAAGMSLMTGWKGECDFIDPDVWFRYHRHRSCPHPPETSLQVYSARSLPSRSGTISNQDLFDTIYNDDSQEREFEHHIYGYDVDMKAVNTANLNVRAPGLARTSPKDFTQPAEKSIIVMTPPYGERISTPNL